jgi:aminoglycoside phosphotransferase family enzyme
MIEVRDLRSAFPDTLLLEPKSDPFASTFHKYTHEYVVEKIVDSECARVVFVRRVSDSQRIVMKLLRVYSDTRYQLETGERRLQCQLEAFKKNSAFSSSIYLGLAPVDVADVEQICPKSLIHIGQSFAQPTEEELDPGLEYALLMRELPDKSRLDVLLKECCESQVPGYLRILTEHISELHSQYSTPLPYAEKVDWGSYEQLEQKLRHNFGLLDLVLTVPESWHCSPYCLPTRLEELKQGLFSILEKNRSCFEQRLQSNYVKRCHGDLKSPNIWILPCDSRENEQAGEYVKILDAIDFNPSYCNIDVLSDFAMLAIDIQARTGDISLVNSIIEYYLERTGQTNEHARIVLGYYLVEKAIVGAAISIVYDKLTELGWQLLEIAEMRLELALKQQIAMATAQELLAAGSPDLVLR